MKRIKPTAGDLEHRITFKTWQDVPGFHTGIDQIFKDPKTVWGRVLPVGALKYQGSVQIDEKVTHLIKVRYNPGVFDTQTINKNIVAEWQGQRFKVKGSSDFEGTREFLFIDCELLGTTS